MSLPAHPTFVPDADHPPNGLGKRRQKRAAPPPPPEPRQVPPEALEAHRLWLESGPEKGSRLVLTGNYPEASLRGQNLRDADLRGVTLVGADLADACLWDADLTDADLTDAKGLAPSWTGQTPPLSGAVLCRATLPEDIAGFGALDNIAELSKNAGKMFVSLLTADVFMQLIVAQTTDVQLVTNSGTTTIPIISATIPIATLFWLGPLVLLTLYVAFHLYLQRLWEMLAGLPAVFPDGMPLTQKSYSWLLSDMVRLGFPRLQRQGQPLGWAQQVLFFFLAYLLVPLTLFPFWARYLCRHEWTITAWHIAYAAAFVWAMLVFFWLAVATLRRDQKMLDRWRERWGFARTGMVLAPLGLALVWGGLVWLLSFCAITWGVPPEQFPFDGSSPATLRLRKSVPYVLEKIGYRPFANLAGAELSTKPDKWTDTKADQLSWVRHPAVLDNIDLRYANLSRAFLVNGNLTNAHLQYAILESANLRGATLPSANLSDADLSRATLADANLAVTTLTRAELTEATLTRAHINSALLTQAVLVRATLTGAHLDGATLTRAYFNGATLTNASLSYATLTRTIWDEKTIWPRDFHPKKHPEMIEVGKYGHPIKPGAGRR